MKRALSILLVEDDPDLGPSTFHGLMYLGHKAVLATSATSAYHYLSKPHHFQLILLDLQLGDRRGEPVIKKLRDQGMPVPPILIHSAQPPDDLRRVADDIGAKGFVQKPASIEQIHRAIELAAA